MKKITIIAILMIGLLVATVVTALPATHNENADLQLVTPDDPHPLNETHVFVRGYICDARSGVGIENASVILWSRIGGEKKSIWHWTK